MVTTTTLRPVGIPEVYSGGSVVGTGDVWADDSAATYARVNYRYPDRPDTYASAYLPAQPDAISAEIVEARIKIATDPANLYGSSTVRLALWNGTGLPWRAPALTFDTSATEHTVTWTSPPPEASVLPLLQSGSLIVLVTEFQPGGPIVAGLDFFFNVYDIAFDMVLDRADDLGVDLLMQGEMLTQTGARPIYTTGLAAGRAATATPMPPTARVETVTADWVQGYAGDGTQLSEPGASQGVLDRDELGDPVEGGRGQERSLVGFTVDLPEDADVSVVFLRVPWSSWWYANGVGALVLGWHDHDTAPEQWSVGAGATQLSSHDVQETDLMLPLQWANAAIGSTFRGLAIGPGLNDGPLYAGATTAAPDQWVLEIHYLSSQEKT